MSNDNYALGIGVVAGVGYLFKRMMDNKEEFREEDWSPRIHRKRRAMKKTRKQTHDAELVYRKYKGRKGPALSATSVKRGTRRRGNDGNMWEVRKSGKSQRWFKGAESFEAETPCPVMVWREGVLTECGWWNEKNEPCVYHPDGEEINAESFEAERKPNQCMHCNEVLYEIEVWEDFRCPHCNNSIGDIYSDEISYDDYMSAESFDYEEYGDGSSVDAWDEGDILEIKLVSPARGEFIWTPKNNVYCGFSIGYHGRRRGCLITSDGVRYHLVGNSLVCDRNNHTISGRTQGSGFPVTVTFGNIQKFNRSCSMIEDKFNAESFEAEKSCIKCGAEATIFHDPILEGKSTLMSRLWLCNNCHSNYLPAFDAEGCDHDWAITCIKCETRLTEDFGDEI